MTSDARHPTATRQRLALVLGPLVIVCCAIWAFRPLPVAIVEPIPPALPRQPSEAPAIPSVDLAAFDVDLWHTPLTPIAEVKAEQPAPPPPSPFKLQLIGILSEQAEDGATRHLAAIYDPDRDRLHIVAAGERIGTATIVGIDRNAVELSNAGRDRTLTLDSGLPSATTLADLIRGGL